MLFIQDEPAGVHWEHPQITVHPTSVFYRCLHESCNEIVREDIIHISGDKKHNKHAVSTFINKSIDHLRSKSVPIMEIIDFTDELHNERLKTNNGHIQKIVFNHPVIVRQTDEKLNGIAGSRNYMHAVRNTGVRGVVQYRFFDCCCYGCTTHNEECSQQDYADDWTTFCLTGKLKDHELQLDSWFKAIGERIQPNNVEEIEQFAESDEEDHTTHEGFICEATPEIPPDCDIRGHLHPNEVFIQNENDKPFVELLDGEFDNDFIDNHTSDVCNDGNEDNDSCVFIAEEEYVSSDYSDESEVEYEAECVQQIDIDNDSSLNFNWSSILEDLQVYKMFPSLLRYVERTCLPNVTSRLKFVMNTDDTVDKVASHFWPGDGPRDYFPVSTYGDGNCLPRSLAHLFLGDENRHKEVRVRITFVAVLKANKFLNSLNLSRGSSEGTENRAASYANYSGMLTPEIMVLHEKAVRSVYERDVLSNRLEGAYMGIWQFHHAAEAFRHPIGSVYPRKTNQILRKDLNRIILPLDSCNDNKRPVYVMWTPMSTKDKHSKVKHFIALMQKVNGLYNLFMVIIHN